MADIGKIRMVDALLMPMVLITPCSARAVSQGVPEFEAWTLANLRSSDWKVRMEF